MSSLRNVAIAVLMLAGAALAYAMKPTQRMADVLGMPDLNVMIPEQFGTWSVDKSIVPIQPSPEVQAVINKAVSYTHLTLPTNREV